MTPEQKIKKSSRDKSRRSSFDSASLQSYSKRSPVYEDLFDTLSKKEVPHSEQRALSLDVSKQNSIPNHSSKKYAVNVSVESSESDQIESNIIGDSKQSKSSKQGNSRRSSGKLHQRTQTFPAPDGDIISIEKYFVNAMASCGYHVIEVDGDGNCLFRAVAHQIWLDEGRHEELRELCMKHIYKHRKRYEMFCPMDFVEYVRAMSIPGTWADDLEIRALEEIFDRLISIYSSENKEIRPINKNFDEELKLGRHVRPIILSYHGGNHYNSVFDERSPLPLGPRTTSIILDNRIAIMAP